MKIWDISRPLNGRTAVYHNIEEKRFRLTAIARHQEDGYHESEMKTNLHTGTHADAPLHMVGGGKKLEELGLTHFIGPAQVIDMMHVTDAIRRADLEGVQVDADRIILFKTRNSGDDDFNPSYVYLEEDAALYLVDLGVRTVGLDAMSIERGKVHHEVHTALLGNGVAIIEDIRLADVEAGRYFLSALPLSILDAEASPVRAVLLEDIDRIS